MLADATPLYQIIEYANQTICQPADLGSGKPRKVAFIPKFLIAENSVKNAQNSVITFGCNDMKNFIMADIAERKKSGTKQLIDFQQLMKIIISNQPYNPVIYSIKTCPELGLVGLLANHKCKITHETYVIYENGLMYINTTHVHVVYGKIKSNVDVKMTGCVCNNMSVRKGGRDIVNMWDPWKATTTCDCVYRIKLIAALLCFNTQY
jgi:hypothetical protein